MRPTANSRSISIKCKPNYSTAIFKTRYNKVRGIWVCLTKAVWSWMTKKKKTRKTTLNPTNLVAKTMKQLLMPSSRTTSTKCSTISTSRTNFSFWNLIFSTLFWKILRKWRVGIKITGSIWESWRNATEKKKIS